MLKIKELRETLGLSQKELAAKIDSTNKNIWAYEKGLAEPNIDTLIRLSAVFNCSVGYLVGNEDDFGSVIINDAPTLSPDEQTVIDCMRKVNDTERKIIVENAKSVRNAFSNKNVKYN